MHPIGRLLQLALFPALLRCSGDLVTAISLVIIATLSTVASVEVAREALEVVKTGSQQEPHGLFVHFPSYSGDEQLLVYGILALSLTGATWICAYFRDFLFERVATEVIFILRVQLFKRIVHMPYVAFFNVSPGILVKRIIEDTAQVRTLVVDAGFRRLADIIFLLIVLAYLWKLDLAMGWVVSGALIFYFLLGFCSARFLKKRLDERDRSRDRLAEVTTEALHRLVDIRCAAKEAWEIDRFDSFARENKSAIIRCSRWLFIDQSVAGFIRALGPIAVLIFGTLEVLHNEMPLSSALALIAGASLLYTPVDALSLVPITIRQMEIAAQNIMKILMEPQEDAEQVLSVSRQHGVSSSIISIRNLHFQYNDNARTRSLVVNELDILPGMKVAIVGASGLGKSTLLRLLFGMLRAPAGTISICGNEMEAWRLPALRQRVSFLAQESNLFIGTIRDNVSYGAVDPNTVNDGQIIAALRLAGLADFADEFKEFRSLELVSAGHNLSLGQRRRICLARALIRRPDVLLLDEPLTGVSPAERQAIASGLLALPCSVTLVVATHDYEILQKMDLIVHLRASSDRVTVAEVARHAQLLETSSDYREAVMLPSGWWR
jgi:ABC-type bacteriocin/lantibiotic exporter with double-glycine peptidase domain